MDLKITPSGQTIVKPTALGPVANTDTKLLIYGLFQKGRVLAQDGEPRIREYRTIVDRDRELCTKADLTSELQRSVRSDEVVIATEQLQV